MNEPQPDWEMRLEKVAEHPARHNLFPALADDIAVCLEELRTLRKESAKAKKEKDSDV